MQVVVPAPVPLHGSVRVPGDKSLGHRCLLFAALRRGRTRVTGLGGGADVRATAEALRVLGVDIAPVPGGWEVRGMGFAGVGAPAGEGGPPGEVAGSGAAFIDCGNAGTAIRLLLGLVAGRAGTVVLDGDASLRQRPMERVAEPLRRMGADVETSAGRPPVRVRGRRLRGATHELAVASAQVKGALLLAGLQADGTTVVVEPAHTRDHTERALAQLGLPVEIDDLRVTVRGPVDDLGTGDLELDVPGDPSSAAFLVAAALLTPGSDVCIRDVCVNPGRIGAFELWRRMGGDVDWGVDYHNALGEPVGWVRAGYSTLGAATVGAAEVVRALDEIPLLAVTAAATGAGLDLSGASELRLKESDRLALLAINLRRLGATVDERPDGLHVATGSELLGGRADAAGDHRIAMALFVGGLAARRRVIVEGWEGVATSYPEFLSDLAALGLKGVA